MLNIIFVSDDTDGIIGPNCTLSHKQFTKNVDLKEDNSILLNGELCTASQVENAITSFNGQKFILIAYSHGCDDALISNVEQYGYISTRNSYFFSSSLIYTNSCYSGIKLKQSLIESGCLGYVGYMDEVRLPENEEDDILFINCENSGLIHFLNSGSTLTESMKVMENKYLEQYEDFVKREMNVAAAFLLHNLNCLTFYDRELLTRNSLEN